MALRLLLVVAALVACCSADPWNSRNDPNNWQEGLTFNFNKLPSSGELDYVPWSDTYWPSYQGGLAHRWNTDDSQDFQYQTFSKSQLQSMSSKDIAKLSPAEKYDIYEGRYDYPTVKSEWDRTSPDDATWEGLCHGWAPAALQYGEQPDAVTLKNKDGISIPFGSSDVKALLTYYVAEYADSQIQTSFVGDRCNFDLDEDPAKENVSACADINAGAYHVLIANLVGVQKVGFIVDRDRSIQVWNQPVYKFDGTVGETRRPSPGASSKAQKEVQVQITMTFTVEVVPQWRKYEPYAQTKQYSYWVELDGDGNVVGGHYDSWDRTDFMWMLSETLNFTGFFADVAAIYDASTRGSSMLAASPFRRARPSAQAIPVRKVDHELTAESGTIELKQYANDEHKGWSIVPPGRPTSVSVALKEFATERYRDKLRIFEGAKGEGALVSVLHGHLGSREVVVNAPAAFVSFTSDAHTSDEGFVLEWKANY